MKGTMRNVVVALTVCASASAAAAQAPQDVERQRRDTQQLRAAQQKVDQAQRRNLARRGGQADASEPFSRVVQLAEGGTFNLQHISGEVRIIGGGREARIEAVKRVRNATNAQARALLDGIRIEVAERSGNVEVRTLHPRAAGRVAVDYAITLPANANLVLRSTSGNLNVQNMAGDEVTANTLSGNVTIRDLRSRFLELHTVGGNMQLHDVATQRARVESMAGNVEFAGRLLRTGQYRLQTHGGNIRVVPSGDSGFDLEAMTFSGDMHSDFVLKLLQPRAGRQPARRVLRGTFGDAGAALTATSFGGNIVIVKP
jgi:hypothetical protein